MFDRKGKILIEVNINTYSFMEFLWNSLMDD